MVITFDILGERVSHLLEFLHGKTFGVPKSNNYCVLFGSVPYCSWDWDTLNKSVQ